MKNKHLRILLQILMLLSAFGGTAPAVSAATALLPQPGLTWKNVNADGARRLTVFSMYTDSRGLLWLGTNHGLKLYDGVTLHTINDGNTAGRQIYSIIEDGDRLYCGSNDGLNIYEFSTGEFHKAPIGAPKEIRSLLRDDDGMWIGSLDSLYRLDLRTGALNNVSAGLPHKSVYSLLRDSRGVLYAGTYSGVARWNPAERRFAPVGTGGRMPAVDHFFANTMLEDAGGEGIYIGGEGGLYLYSPVSDTWTAIDDFTGINVKSLAQDRDRRLIAGTDAGLYEGYGSDSKHYLHDSRHPESLANNEIWCVGTDRHNNILAGHERGFSIAASTGAIREIKLSDIVHSGEGNEIHDIYRDSRGELWLGGTNGLIRLRSDGRPEWYRNGHGQAGTLSHNRVRTIREDAGGRMWFATDAGINRFDPSGSFEIFHLTDSAGHYNTNWVYTIDEDGDDLWFGGFLGGVHRIAKSRLDGPGDTLTADRSLNHETRTADGSPALPNSYVNNIVNDHRGHIWVLMFRDSNICRLDLATGSITRYDVREISGKDPVELVRDSRGRIWCAVEGGAVVFGPDGSSRTLTFPPTLSDENVLAIGAVGDDVWISTMSNVWRVDGETLRASLLPLPQKEYAAIYDDRATGRVVLGGSDEIIEVEPQNLDELPDHNSISLVFADRGDGTPDLSHAIDGNEGLELPYGGAVNLYFSSLQYSPGIAQRYMYKIAQAPEDTAGGWIVMPEGVNNIRLSDLRMGDYNVLIKPVGGAAAPAAVRLRVGRPAALSWWAIGLYVLLAGAIVYIIIMYMRRRNERIMRQEERRKSLENAERKLSFLSDISHDLKTPLSMILGPVSVLREKTGETETRRALDGVYQNAVRLNNLIHKTIELQTIKDTDEDMLILSRFDAVEFCSNVFDTFRENNPQKQFVFHTDSPEIMVEADAVKFESVVTNLLSNACKYSPDSATVSLGIHTGESKVYFIVSDSGVGISEADQPLVFQRMFRAPSQAELHEGTGLGLYLIKKYLELMHGTVELYSREGQGTSFIVTLPATEDSANSALSAAETAPENDTRCKILIVEDNAQICHFLRSLLDKEYNCLTADNGRAGLAIAASFEPDIIIADEMMPVMTGLEMVRRLKHNPRLASVPIILLTAKSGNDLETESIKLGVDVFMPKPFEPRILLARIANILASRARMRESVRVESITEAKPIEAESIGEKQLAAIAKIVEDNISDPDLNVNFLCERSGMQNKALYRLIKKYTGYGPLDYIRRVRLQKAAMLLEQGRFSVSEICYMVGFKTPSYFSKCFQAQFGTTPSGYKGS